MNIKRKADHDFLEKITKFQIVVAWSYLCIFLPAAENIYISRLIKIYIHLISVDILLFFTTKFYKDISVDILRVFMKLTWVQTPTFKANTSLCLSISTRFLILFT